jgi:shikimate kinase
MVGFGTAIAYGAVTVINAIATSKGAALGVNLWTKANVRLTGEKGVINGTILSEPNEDTTLIEESILTVLKYFHVENEFGAEGETESNIPIAKGLKSSSVASNALVLATIGALGKKVDDFTILNLSIDASIKAKTTITGAFDDASASFFGDITLTDNLKRRILKRFTIKEDLTVLMHIPSEKSYTFKSNVERMRLIAPQIKVAFREALLGNYWTALTMNGILYATVLGYEQKLAIDALEAGAIASGLSGKGPATVAIAYEGQIDKILDAWHTYDGEVIQGKVNHDKARIMRKE